MAKTIHAGGGFFSNAGSPSCPLLTLALILVANTVQFRTKLLGNYNLQDIVLRQAIGAKQFRGSCFVSSYWGTTTCRVLFCPKQLGNYNLQSESGFIALLKEASSFGDPVHH